MEQDKLIAFLKIKLNHKNFDLALSNIIYRYYIPKKDSSWDLKKVQFIGVGKIVRSNYHLVSEDRPLAWDYSTFNSHQFLILFNKQNKQINGLLLPPLNHDDYVEWKSFQYAFPLFDDVQSGISDDENMLFTNIFNEQIEVEVQAINEPMPFYELLNDKFKKLNDVLVEYADRGDYPRLSSLMAKKVK